MGHVEKNNASPCNITTGPRASTASWNWGAPPENASQMQALGGVERQDSCQLPPKNSSMPVNLLEVLVQAAAAWGKLENEVVKIGTPSDTASRMKLPPEPTICMATAKHANEPLLRLRITPKSTESSEATDTPTLFKQNQSHNHDHEVGVPNPRRSRPNYPGVHAGGVQKRNGAQKNLIPRPPTLFEDVELANKFRMAVRHEAAMRFAAWLASQKSSLNTPPSPVHGYFGGSSASSVAMLAPSNAPPAPAVPTSVLTAHALTDVNENTARHLLYIFARNLGWKITGNIGLVPK